MDDDWYRFQSQFRETVWERNERLKGMRLAKRKCIDCLVNIADHPDKRCPGCEAYLEHLK